MDTFYFFFYCTESSVSEQGLKHLWHITINYFSAFNIPPINYTGSPQDENVTDKDVSQYVIKCDAFTVSLFHFTIVAP